MKQFILEILLVRQQPFFFVIEYEKTKNFRNFLSSLMDFFINALFVQHYQFRSEINLNMAIFREIKIALLNISFKLDGFKTYPFLKIPFSLRRLHILNISCKENLLFHISKIPVILLQRCNYQKIGVPSE